jgi:hypothetical protein
VHAYEMHADGMHAHEIYAEETLRVLQLLITKIT